MQMAIEALSGYIPKVAWSGPIKEEPTMIPLDLDHEIKASGLTQEDIELLRNHSAGVLSFYDFAKMWVDSESVDKGDGKRGYSLGLSNDLRLYPYASIAYDLYHWEEGYEMYDISVERGQEDPSEYLEAITATDKPIVFFVPRDIHSRIGSTRDEMLWFLRNANSGNARNSYFVFGLYSIIDKETYLTKIPKHREPQQAKMTDMMRNPQRYISR